MAAEGGSGHPLSELSASAVDRDRKMQGQTDTEGDGERRGGERGGAGGREQEKVGCRGTNSGVVTLPSLLGYQNRLSCDHNDRPSQLCAEASTLQPEG